MGSLVPAYGHGRSPAYATVRRSALTGGFVAAALWTSGAAVCDAQVTIESRETWSNIYGAAPFTRNVTVKSERALVGRLAWGLSLGGRTVARGERAMRAEPGKAATVALALTAPPVKDGVILAGRLTVAVSVEGESRPQAEVEQALVFFPRDPFAGRAEWLNGLKLAVYDPARSTTEAFEKAAIPFEPVREPAALDSLTEGTIVIGESVAWDEERGLAEAVLQAAARGRPVLCLAPAPGRLVLPGLGDPPLAAPRRLSWRRNDVIADFDKRLDSRAWPPNGQVVARSLATRAEGNELVALVADGSAAWPWFEAEFAAGQGRLIVCGFGIVAHWEDGPTPTFLLAKILERLSQDPQPHPERRERTER
jgi:hypothetical protein